MTCSSRRARRVLLIGWDAADWKLLNPYLDAGEMPHLKALVERGAMAKMATMTPALSPLLWTTAVTGAKPDRHGILGFIEPDPVTGGVRLISSTSRKTKAVWNILHQSGMRSVVVNWFASHPAEPVNGAIVTDAFNKAVGPKGAEWPIPPGAVHPEALAEKLKPLRLHAGEQRGNDLALFVPEFGRVDQSRDRRLGSLAKVLAENLSAHAAATWLMEHEAWDFMAVFYDAIDHASHGFMAYHPPALEGVSADDAEIYGPVVHNVCRYMDLMLGRLVQLAGPETVIILMSDHGVHSDHLRPRGEALYKPETPAQVHRSHGIFCMAGPGIKKDELIYGVELGDITPTILNLLGLPAARDMKGRVLAEAWEAPPAIEPIASWEEVAGECGRHPADTTTSAWDTAAALEQLAELGYLEKPDGKAQERAKVALQHHDFCLGRVYLAAQRPAEALPLFERLVEERPEEAAFGLHLAQCQYELGRREECRRAVEAVLSQDENRPSAGLIQANLALAEDKPEEALQYLLEAEAATRPTPAIRQLTGCVHLRQKRYAEAERVFRSVLELDPDHAGAMLGLAQTLMAQRQNRAAAEAALNAIRLRFDLPEAHFTLGVALGRMGRPRRAAQAFETCQKLRPEHGAAGRNLAVMKDRIAKQPLVVRVRGSKGGGA
ncbi:MAG: alkaline phosphatase family protein [Terriglobales bacterium]